MASHVTFSTLGKGGRYKPSSRLPFSEVERYDCNFDLNNPESFNLFLNYHDCEEGPHSLKFISASQDPTDATYFGISCGIILKYHDECLIVQRKATSPAFPNQLVVPATYIKEGESLRDCAIRVLSEKIIIDDRKKAVIGRFMKLGNVIESIPTSKTHNIMFIFCYNINEKFEVKDPSECTYMKATDIKNNLKLFTPGFAKLFGESYQNEGFSIYH